MISQLFYITARNGKLYITVSVSAADDLYNVI